MVQVPSQGTCTQPLRDAGLDFKRVVPTGDGPAAGGGVSGKGASTNPAPSRRHVSICTQMKVTEDGDVYDTKDGLSMEEGVIKRWYKVRTSGCARRLAVPPRQSRGAPSMQYRHTCGTVFLQHTPCLQRRLTNTRDVVVRL